MKATKEQQKEHALKLMKILFKYKPIIRAFNERDEVWFSEGQLGASYTSDDEPILTKKLEELRQKNFLPFHATHDYVDGMETWTIMVVGDDDEDFEYELEDAKDGLVFCYAYNVKEPMYSEFGDCQFRASIAGDVLRMY